MMRRILLSLVVVGLTAAPALSQSVRQIGEFRDWTAYGASDGSGSVCFALSKPTEVSPTPDGYTQAYLYMSNRPGESVTNEFNLVAGYTFAPDTPAVVSIGGQSFQLFTEADAAWLDDAGQSDALASAIRAGSSLVVEGTSDRGIKVRQTFSLSGATAASRAIGGQC